MKPRANSEIRREAKRQGIPLWMVADGMGISAETLTRRLRHEFSTEEKQRALNVIEALAAEACTHDE